MTETIEFDGPMSQAAVDAAESILKRWGERGKKEFRLNGETFKGVLGGRWTITSTNTVHTWTVSQFSGDLIFNDDNWMYIGECQVKANQSHIGPGTWTETALVEYNEYDNEIVFQFYSKFCEKCFQSGRGFGVCHEIHAAPAVDIGFNGLQLIGEEVLLWARHDEKGGIIRKIVL